MNFTNFTPFEAQPFSMLNQHDREYHVVAIRGTFDIQPGKDLIISQEQACLVMDDEYHGEVGKSSLKQESDIALYKPKCDVIVIGNAYTPEKKPARFFNAGIKITNSGKSILNKQLIFTGPRFWKKRFLLPGWKLTYPELTMSVPLRYEYAHGGECRINAGDPAAKRVRRKYRLTPEQNEKIKGEGASAPIANTACETNTVGCGYAEKWYLKAKKLKKIPAPQIEAHNDPIRKFRRQYNPQGFGPIDRSWLPRRKYTGTYDKAWLEERWPKLPKDFDFAYNNCAHPDLQVPHLKGDEQIELINFTPKGTLKFQLPGHTLYVLSRREDGQIAMAPAKLDTLIIEPDANKASIVWRASVAVEPKVRLLEARLIQKDDKEARADFAKTLEAADRK